MRDIMLGYSLFVEKLKNWQEGSWVFYDKNKRTYNKITILYLFSVMCLYFLLTFIEIIYTDFHNIQDYISICKSGINDEMKL